MNLTHRPDQIPAAIARCDQRHACHPSMKRPLPFELPEERLGRGSIARNTTPVQGQLSTCAHGLDHLPADQDPRQWNEDDQ